MGERVGGGEQGDEGGFSVKFNFESDLSCQGDVGAEEDAMSSGESLQLLPWLLSHIPTSHIAYPLST